MIEDSNSMRSSVIEGQEFAVSKPEIEAFINQKDLSWVFTTGLIEKDLNNQPNKSKVVSKILYSQGKYIMTYIEGYLS